MQVSQIFRFSLLAVFGDPHPRGFEMRGDEEWWWHGRDSQGRAYMFPREQGTVRRVGWKNPSGRRLTTERKKVRNAQSLEKVDLEDETGFRIATREGACSWEVQHSAKSLLNLSCWSKPWPHQLVQNWITWQQLFCPSARGSQLGEEHILEPECKWGVRNYDREEWREQSGSETKPSPETPAVLLWLVCPQTEWDWPFLARDRDSTGQSAGHSWLVSASRAWSPFWGKYRRGDVKERRDKAQFTSMREFGIGRRFSAWLLHMNCSQLCGCRILGSLMRLLNCPKFSFAI